MEEHPILFSTPMVQSIIEGRKTKTRRTFADDLGRLHMPKIILLSCPHCDCVWDQEEIEEGICGACGYPNREEDSIPERDDINDYEDEEEPVGYQCIGCGTSRGHPGICPVCDNPMDPYY